MCAEIIDVAGEIGARWSKRLLNPCMKQCKVPEDWRTGLIVPIWKMKGHAQYPGKYRVMTLLSHIKDTWLWFLVDLEKALDTVPIKIAMDSLIWMGAPES